MADSFIAHVEIPSTNFNKSKEYYKKVLDWEFKPFGNGYLLYNTHKGFTVGLRQVEKIKSEDTTIFHVRTSNVDETLKKSEEAGGKVYREKTTIPAMGYYALVTDPDGNIIGLYQGN